MISWVNRARCSVAFGRKANMCQICGYSAPFDCIAWIRSRYRPGCGLPSTPGRNIGFILLSRIAELYFWFHETSASAPDCIGRMGRVLRSEAVFGPALAVDRTAARRAHQVGGRSSEPAECV